MRDFHPPARIIAPVMLLLAPLSSAAMAQPEDEDFSSGLLATYTVGSQRLDRVDSMLSFDWGGLAPDERLPVGKFTAEWTGRLLVRAGGRHSFHSFVAGDVSISVNGEPVLRASELWGFVSGQPLDLPAGDHSIHVRYSTPQVSDKPRARLNVFWSSDAFTLEPLSADVLFREESSPAQIAAHGRVQADALRCAACHKANVGLPALAAVSLTRVQGSQSRSTLIRRLLDPSSIVGNSHMPNFGFTDEEAGHIADFLFSISKESHDISQFSLKTDDADNGRLLLASLGCVACHRVPNVDLKTDPLASPYEGPDLATTGQRRSAAWIDRWLKSPESLNADHRMPVFDLSGDERRQLVAALTVDAKQTTQEKSSSTAPEDIEAGKRLVTKAGCAACHQIPGVGSLAVAPLTANSFQGDAVNCLSPHTDNRQNEKRERRLPSYRLTPKIQTALTAWGTTLHSNSDLNASATGEWLLHRKGCLACHDRNVSRGLSSLAAQLQTAHPKLKGQSQGMVPPPLTAVGDKLQDDYLRKAVAGKHRERRLPWLTVRMPEYRHTDRELAALQQHLITEDRIPDEADAARKGVLADVETRAPSAATAAELLLGNHLTGAAGFNCVACHKAGPFEPRNVALGTRGSDIMTMGNRIRPRFFQRWMKNPIRVVAGIEMPAIKKAMPGILEESIPRQMAAIWTAISDSKFHPPTVTSNFEQFVNVAAGSQPRVIRDVFTIGVDKDREPVARAMAIGFGNGHNILLDLNSMQIRLWTIGEFARQRTEGKSWYWDMPGTVVQHSPVAPFALTINRDGNTFAAVPDEGRWSELLSYELIPNGIQVECRSWFDLSENKSTAKDDTEPHFTQSAWSDPKRPLQAVITRHTFEESASADQQQGWNRTLEVLECPSKTSVPVNEQTLLAVTKDAPIHADRRSQSDRKELLRGQRTRLSVSTELARLPARNAIPKPLVLSTPQEVTSTPGFVGQRLPIDTSIMPTAMTWLDDGRMAFTSLKGHVWIAEDTDKDGLPDRTQLFEEGLAAPFGILTDGQSILVSHKPEIVRLTDTNNDGRADAREIVASGWGFNDNYHDWASGLTRDKEGNMYLGLGSDYSQKTRPASQDRWRGGVIQIDPSGVVTPLAMSMRYPMGLAFDRHGNLFATDNQGVQNTFNEINHILPGRHYGVPSRHQPSEDLKPESPAIMVPHPWTRSVNSILFLPENFPITSLRGHGIGCEYDSRFLIRFTMQNVDGILQGASYRFSRPNEEAGGSNFIGPICSAVAPDGAIYIGSIWDSGWQGGRNTGGITRLAPSVKGMPNGIREITATTEGFEVEFFEAVDRAAALDPKSWSLQAYTRKWGGGYATPDSGRHAPTAKDIQVLDNGQRVRLNVSGLKPGHIYDISTGGKLQAEQLWPSEAHYSMKVVPK